MSKKTEPANEAAKTTTNEASQEIFDPIVRAALEKLSANDVVAEYMKRLRMTPYLAMYACPEHHQQQPVAANLPGEQIRNLALPVSPQALTLWDIGGAGSVTVTVFLANRSEESEATSTEEEQQIDEYLAHIENAREKMRKDQEEIDKLGVETREMIGRLMTR